MIRAYHAIVTTYGFWLPNDNPIKDGKPKQKWTFVVPFENKTTDKDEIIIV